MTGATIEQAFLRACALDVDTIKPGNVSRLSPGHGMTAAQFLASAAAAATVLCRPGAPVGERILAAVEATQAVAGCNTNLGIVLLCAPIAAALEATEGGATGLRHSLQAVLDGLTVADARAAFRAIVLANPGGLGSSLEQDVHGDPTMDLGAAMELARERDLIARQYASGYGDLFDTGLGEWQAALATGHHNRQLAMQRVFLAFLSRFPDSHIVRKQGLPAAQSVSQSAQYWYARLVADVAGSQAGTQAGLAGWDEELKTAGLNPGTSADLSVATAFIAGAIGTPPGVVPKQLA